MSNGNHLLVEVLLCLDVGLTTGLSHSIQLLGLFDQLLSLSADEADGDFFLLDHNLHLVQLLPLRCPLLLFRGGPLLEEGAPLHERCHSSSMSAHSHCSTSYAWRSAK
jgi:hypothetical protein